MATVTPARGMRDILPDEFERRASLAAVIEETYSRYGYRRIETPALEHLELLQSSDGGENEKLIYHVMRRGITAADLEAAAGIEPASRVLQTLALCPGGVVEWR